jgi:deoxyadenosine/deoxycytidine kinase
MSSLGRPFIVALSGPTGAGKSSVGALVGQRSDVVFVSEPDPSVLLTQLTGDTGRINAADIERWIIRERHRSILGALSKAVHHQVVLIDRLLSEDREIFVQLHYRNGSIDGVEMADLDQLVDALQADVTEPNLHVFFSADIEGLRARLRGRSEGKWLIEHLGLQLMLYREYRNRLESSGRPIVSIDTSLFGPDDLLKQSQLCWDRIDAARLPVAAAKNADPR